MTDQPPISPPPFLDVSTLIESSRPTRRGNWFWAIMGIFLLLTILGSIGGDENESARTAVAAFTGLLMLATLVSAVVISYLTVRRLRTQQQTVDAIDEMLQLRRWEPAGMLLERFLTSPARTGRLWAQALVQLAALLGRHHRFEDAIFVQSFLIENEMLDNQSEYYLRLSRAMFMLREDHLVDADRAISDLRRRGPSGGTGGLALLEMFRDVKTGHPDEAVELFTKHLSQMQQQLGHRVADAHALVAKAYDLLNMEPEAKAAYERATLLAPPSELIRRYPELTKLAEKYPPSLAPREAA